MPAICSPKITLPTKNCGWLCAWQRKQIGSTTYHRAAL